MSFAAKSFVKLWQIRVEVNLTLYRPRQALRLPGFQIRTLRWQGWQPNAPATYTPELSPVLIFVKRQCCHTFTNSCRLNITSTRRHGSTVWQCSLHTSIFLYKEAFCGLGNTFTYIYQTRSAQIGHHRIRGTEEHHNTKGRPWTR